MTLSNVESQPLHIKKRIFADRVDLLNQSVLFSVPTNLFCASLVFWGLFKVIDHSLLFNWFFAMLVALALRSFIFIYISNSNKSAVFKMNFLLIGSALSAVLWGMASTFLMPNIDLLHEMLLIIIIIGLTSGGLHTLQADFMASVMFFTLTLFPLGLWFFTQSSFTYCLLGFALIIYYIFLLIVSRYGYNLLYSNLCLRYENLDLVDKLSNSNAILEESEARFHSAFDFTAIGMAMVGLDGKWIKANKSLCQIIGYSQDELVGMDFQQITHPDDLQSDMKFMEKLSSGEINHYHLEKRYVHKNGSLVWALLSVSLIRDNENQPLYYISQLHSIDNQKKAEGELTFLAYHDELTGLSNRKQLDSSFDIALAYAKRNKTKIAVLFIDLDHFKEVNDSLGHVIGDLLLVEVAARLKAVIRSTDILIRLGGDEFFIALTELTSLDQVIDISNKILKK